MERAGRWEKLGDWGWLLFWGALSSVWCVTAAARLGATFDEPLYVQRGLEGWRAFSHYGLLKVGTMPLPIDVETLPLYLHERYTGTRLNPVDDLPRLLVYARLGMLAFWWLLLVYGRLWGRALAGPWGGRLAVAFLAVEPALLANASLATTDVPLSACLLALVYHFRQSRTAAWRWRVGVPALWFAAAVLAKASGLVFSPICLFVVELERLARSGALTGGWPDGWRARVGHLWALWAPWRRDMVRSGLLGLALVFVYCGSDFQTEPSFVAWAHGLPEGGGREGWVWLADHLRIFPNAGEGLVRQIKHNLHGHTTYLLGQGEARAFWYYFPVLLTIKLTLPILLAPLVVALLRPRSLLNTACFCAAVLVVASVNFRVQIGIRLILPLVALLVIGVAAAAADAAARLGPSRRRWALRGFVAAGLLWTAAADARVWPHGLCYLNELWGRPIDGYRHVADANYDWGQGLPELARWQRRHRLETLDVWYYGTDPLMDRLPMRHQMFHVMPIHNEADIAGLVRGHRVAVSTTLLCTYPMTDAHRYSAAFFRGHPERRVGRTMTFFIYDFTQPGDNRTAAR